MDSDNRYNYQVPTPNTEFPSPNVMFQRARDSFSPSPYNSKSLPSTFRELTLKDVGNHHLSEASSVSDFGSQDMGSNMYEEMGLEQDIKLFDTTVPGIYPDMVDSRILALEFMLHLDSLSH